MNCQLLSADDLSDFKTLLACYEIAFEMDNFKSPGDDHLLSVLADDRFRAFVATVDGQVIGGLTGFILPQYYTAKPQFYLYDMAVLPAYHRRGVGQALIGALKSYCIQSGFDNFFVQADVEDTHALEFYRATGGIAAEVVHFTYVL